VAFGPAPGKNAECRADGPRHSPPPKKAIPAKRRRFRVVKRRRLSRCDLSAINKHRTEENIDRPPRGSLRDPSAAVLKTDSSTTKLTSAGIFSECGRPSWIISNSKVIHLLMAGSGQKAGLTHLNIQIDESESSFCRRTHLPLDGFGKGTWWNNGRDNEADRMILHSGISYDPVRGLCLGDAAQGDDDFLRGINATVHGDHRRFVPLQGTDRISAARTVIFQFLTFHDTIKISVSR
jgi:hypothetical protein